LPPDVARRRPTLGKRCPMFIPHRLALDQAIVPWLDAQRYKLFQTFVERCTGRAEVVDVRGWSHLGTCQIRKLGLAWKPLIFV
jgi:hypothetical protein